MQNIYWSYIYYKITFVNISLVYAVFFKLKSNLLANSGKSPSASVYSIKTKEPFAIKEYKIIKINNQNHNYSKMSSFNF